jgi:hypothetical protein
MPAVEVFGRRSILPNQGEAEKAIAQLNGKDVGGRALRINEARPKEQRR